MIEMAKPTTMNKDFIKLPPATAAPPAMPIIIRAKMKTIQIALPVPTRIIIRLAMGFVSAPE